MTNERRMVLIALVFAVLMGLEVAASAAGRATETSWRDFIGRMDDALARQDVSEAERAAHEAYAAALGSRTWEGMIAVADAYHRLGDVTGFHAVTPRARQAYLMGFFRARQQGSLAGVLGATEGFAGLGDREVARQCLKTAEQLASRDGDPASRDRLAIMSWTLAGPEMTASF